MAPSKPWINLRGFSFLRPFHPSLLIHPSFSISFSCTSSLSIPCTVRCKMQISGSFCLYPPSIPFLSQSVPPPVAWKFFSAASSSAVLSWPAPGYSAGPPMTPRHAALSSVPLSPSDPRTETSLVSFLRPAALLASAMFQMEVAAINLALTLLSPFPLIPSPHLCRCAVPPTP